DLTPRIIPRGLFFVQVPENPSNRNAPFSVFTLPAMFGHLSIKSTDLHFAKYAKKLSLKTLLQPINNRMSALINSNEFAENR
ncbi:hypothetical protein, partial [Neobacillus muris]|uniref:hypothetical protein n=1 Tax=Neobacillus muris TaxID=2941334 RepID=UPI00203DD733